MFPLGSVLLPGERLPLRVFEPRYRQMLDDCLSEEAPSSPLVPDGAHGFGVVLIERGHEVGGGDARTGIGTFATIDTVVRDPDGQSLLSCTGTWRFRVNRWLPDDPYPRADITPLPEPPADDAATAGLVTLGSRIRSLIEESFARRDLPVGDDIPRFDATDLAEVGIFGWAARLPIGAADRQALLEADDGPARCHVFDDALATLEARIRFGS
jgi:Lon protease-like protein